VESLLRRLRGDVQTEKNLAVSGISVNREKFIVEKKDEQIQLPKKEFELLELLLSRPGKVFTRDEILNLVWGNEAIVGERTIDVHVRKLREKLGDDYIRTIKGVGYTFVDSEK
jgi:two-component system alkaline phosphatase synthesis response regulator PhoP